MSVNRELFFWPTPSQYVLFRNSRFIPLAQITTILTHSTSVKLKSEGDIVVRLLWQYRHRLYFHWFKVVPDNCIYIVVPLEYLKMSKFCFLASNNFMSTYAALCFTSDSKYRIGDFIFGSRLPKASTMNYQVCQCIKNKELFQPMHVQITC